MIFSIFIVLSLVSSVFSISFTDLKELKDVRLNVSSSAVMEQVRLRMKNAKVTLKDMRLTRHNHKVGKLDSSVMTPFSVYTDGIDVFFVDSALHVIFSAPRPTTDPKELKDTDIVDPSEVTLVCGTPGSPGFSGTHCSAAQFRRPRGVWGANNKLFVADTHNYRIRQIDLTTGDITTIAGTGVQGYSGDGGLAVDAQLYSPFQGWTSTDGKTYFTEFHKCVVRWIDTDGKIYTLAGTGVCANGADGPIGTQIPLNKPWGVAGYPGAGIFVTEFAGHKVRVINPTTTEIITVAGTGIPGTDPMAVNSNINSPTGIAVDPNFEAVLWGESELRVIKFLSMAADNFGVHGPFFLVPGKPRGLAFLEHVYVALPARNQLYVNQMATCFSGDTLVRILPKTSYDSAPLSSKALTIAMKDLRVGDRVEVRPNEFEEVIEFLHRDTTSTAEYLRITVESEGLTEGAEEGESEWVELTHRHLIRTKKGGFVFAETVTMEDELLVKGKWKKVRSIECVERVGVYAPSTWSGVFLADGIEVSCYAYFQHTYSFAYMRLRNIILYSIAPVRSVWSMLTGVNDDIDNKVVNIGEDWIQQTLLSLAKTYLPHVTR